MENTHKTHASSQNRRKLNTLSRFGFIYEIIVERRGQQNAFPLNECRNESHEWIITGGRTANRLVNPKHQVTRVVPQRAMVLGMPSTSGLTRVLIKGESSWSEQEWAGQSNRQARQASNPRPQLAVARATGAYKSVVAVIPGSATTTQ